MGDSKLMRWAEIPSVDRGEGITSKPLVGEATGAKVFSSGVTTFPPGAAIDLHTHNCDEQVTLLEGQGTVEVDGRRSAVAAYDTTFVPAGVPHRFINNGKGIMRILWVYASIHVTRTFAASGKTVHQLSAEDLAH